MEMAVGGVIINPDGLVLLREPSHHCGGYVWTFAKGRPKPGESEIQTALREVLEETGVVAQVVAQLPAVFWGCLTATKFFLMKPIRETRQFCWETKTVRWVTEAQARQMLPLTKHAVGRERDRQILACAFAVLQMSLAGQHSFGLLHHFSRKPRLDVECAPMRVRADGVQKGKPLLPSPTG
jgi:8-oxo-dGTP diphosphatase